MAGTLSARFRALNEKKEEEKEKEEVAAAPRPRRSRVVVIRESQRAMEPVDWCRRGGNACVWMCAWGFSFGVVLVLAVAIGLVSWRPLVNEFLKRRFER